MSKVASQYHISVFYSFSKYCTLNLLKERRLHIHFISLTLDTQHLHALTIENNLFKVAQNKALVFNRSY